MIDAPVSGGPARARDGTLTMMVGCPAEDWADVEPVLRAMSTKQIRIGDVGAGHVAKIANNLLLASHLALAGEVVHMAKSAGVDPANVLIAINSATGRSMVTEHNYHAWILNNLFNSGFTMALMRKDVRLSQQLIASVDAQLPVASAAVKLWAESHQHLADEEDFNRIVEMPARTSVNESR
jgi:3-hydroxyisobutyrate dehydrogenase